jgi:hypothetical protein
MRDLLSETLWLDRRGVVVTADLLAEALKAIEDQYGVGQALDQDDMAIAVVRLIRARQAAEADPLRGARIAIRQRG